MTLDQARGTVSDTASPNAAIGRLADVGIFYFAQQLINLRGLLLIPLIARMLGVEAYGTLVLAWNAVMLVQVLTALAFPLGVVRLLSARPEPAAARTALPTIGLFVLVPWTVLAGGLVLAAQALSGQMPVPALHTVALVVAMKALFETWYFIFSSYWMASSRSKRYVVLQVAFHAGDLGVVSVALLTGQGVAGILTASALWEGAYVAGLIAMVLRETGIGRPDGAVLTRYLAFCLPAVVPQVMLWILGLSDRFVLAAFRDTDVVGIYNAAYNLANLIVAYNTAVWFVFAPRASRRHDHDGAAGARSELRAALRLFLALGLPMAVGVSALAGPLLDLLLHQDVPVAARIVVPIVCLGTLANALYVAASWSFSLRLDNRPLTVLALAAGVINLGTNLLLVPPLGMVGAALSTALSYVLLAALGFYFERHYLLYAVPWGFTCRAAIAAAVMGGVLAAIPIPSHLFWLALAVVAGAVAYSGLLLALGGVSGEERQHIRGVLALAAARMGFVGTSRC
jgi:O-antigen/teichoic acid export membrane protein